MPDWEILQSFGARDSLLRLTTLEGVVAPAANDTPPRSQFLSPLELGAFLGPGSLLLVPQQPAQNLATGALWDHVEELNAALDPLVWCLVFLHMLKDGLHYLVFRLVGHSRRLYDECFWNFACRVVRNLDHCTVGNSRMGQEVGLEFCRGDLVA